MYRTREMEAKLLRVNKYPVVPQVGAPSKRGEQLMRDVLRSRWMITAIFVEILGLVAALGTIPGLGPFPVVAMLSATAILSSFGVVIVTTYFVVQYNRRPLNAVQKEEIGEAYPTRQEVEEALASKSELASLEEELRSFLSWRFRCSVVAFASEVQDLRHLPGYIVVAELEKITKDAHIVRFCSVLPPVPVVEDPRGSAGDNLPKLYSDYGTLFKSDTVILVVYLGVGNQLRVLQSDHGGQGTFYYYEELSSPVHSSLGTTEPKPRLMRNNPEQSEYGWYWEEATD